ncbi:protein of unknown function [Azospirillum baldaniorum]|uniref:Uncharacterized protein n=1 Tax=Azospirillum baldaniorum TaxID=1064539 RepID=A0A9P1JPF7_9PROT|nr:protein of unknown function [Azospirillum baldaniorum]
MMTVPVVGDVLRRVGPRFCAFGLALLTGFRAFGLALLALALPFCPLLLARSPRVGPGFRARLLRLGALRGPLRSAGLPGRRLC